jgi:hypothetical protein
MGDTRGRVSRRVAMATVLAGKHDFLVYSDRGTLLGFGRTLKAAIEKSQRHPKIVELGAEIVVRNK